MKKLLVFYLGVMSLFSCQKDDDENNDFLNQNNLTAEHLKEVINQNNIEAVQACCEGCICQQSLGDGTDFSFPGDNFVRIQEDYYNLNQLNRYTIDTVGNSVWSEIRLVLFFPN